MSTGTPVAKLRAALAAWDELRLPGVAMPRLGCTFGELMTWRAEAASEVIDAAKAVCRERPKRTRKGSYIHGSPRKVKAK